MPLAVNLSSRGAIVKANRKGFKALVCAVLIGLSVLLTACDDPVQSGKDVVDCYNKTGMGTSCLYGELK